MFFIVFETQKHQKCVFCQKLNILHMINKTEFSSKVPVAIIKKFYYYNAIYGIERAQKKPAVQQALRFLYSAGSIHRASMLFWQAKFLALPRYRGRARSNPPDKPQHTVALHESQRTPYIYQ
jgi:hypothetical protein